jgi:hypothetical protein
MIPADNKLVLAAVMILQQIAQISMQKTISSPFYRHCRHCRRIDTIFAPAPVGRLLAKVRRTV